MAFPKASWSRRLPGPQDCSQITPRVQQWQQYWKSNTNFLKRSPPVENGVALPFVDLWNRLLQAMCSITSGYYKHRAMRLWDPDFSGVHTGLFPLGAATLPTDGSCLPRFSSQAAPSAWFPTCTVQSSSLCIPVAAKSPPLTRRLVPMHSLSVIYIILKQDDGKGKGSEHLVKHRVTSVRVLEVKECQRCWFQEEDWVTRVSYSSFVMINANSYSSSE